MYEDMTPYCFHSAEELIAMERELIRSLGTLAPDGMNLDPGGSLGSHHNAKPVYANGKRYETTLEACEENGVNIATYLYRVKHGWSIEAALGNEPPPERTDLELFVVQGRRHRGRAALAEAHGLKRATVVSRLAKGWTPEQAVGVASPPKRQCAGRQRFQGVDTFALSRKCGIAESTLRHRIYQQGMSLEEALLPGKRNGGYPVCFTHKGKSYSFASLRQAAAYFGVNYSTVKRRLRNGATIKQALGLVPLPSRRRHLPSGAKQSSPRATPTTFQGVPYLSVSDAARGQGCVSQQDINWFIGLVRAGKQEVEILRRIGERLRTKHKSTK